MLKHCASSVMHTPYVAKDCGPTIHTPGISMQGQAYGHTCNKGLLTAVPRHHVVRRHRQYFKKRANVERSGAATYP